MNDLLIVEFDKEEKITIQEALNLFGYLRDPQKSYPEMFNLVRTNLPKSVYRNYVLYILLVEKIFKQKYHLNISDKTIFNLENMKKWIEKLDSQQQEEIFKLIKEAAPLMFENVDMTKKNALRQIEVIKRIGEKNLGHSLPNNGIEIIFKAKLDEDKKDRLETVETDDNIYKKEKGDYEDSEFFDLKSPYSHLELFVSLLTEKSLTKLVDSQVSMPEKLETIITLFPEPSGKRDYFLNRLLKRKDISHQDIAKALKYFQNPYLQEKYARQAIEMEIKKYPDEFETFEQELAKILYYFPQFSYTRDELLFQLVDQKATVPIKVAQANQYLLSYIGNIRKHAKFIRRKDLVRELIKELPAKDKKDFLLWLFGMRNEKPRIMIDLEYRYRINFDSLKDIYIQPNQGYYQNAGEKNQQEFLRSLFYGDKGLFAAQETQKDFLDEIFKTILPGREKSLQKVFYDTVFNHADNYRKEKVLVVLLRKLSQFAKNEDSSSPDTKVQEAKAIAIFLEALGPIWVKFAQAAVSSGLIADKTTRQELSRLKDKVKTFYKGLAFLILEKAFVKFENMFSELGGVSGSGAIMVVYKATLLDGTKVAVKVKRPEIDKQIDEELQLLRNVINDKELNSKLTEQKIYIPSELLEQIEKMIKKELQLSLQKGNAEKFLTQFRDRPSSIFLLLKGLRLMRQVNFEVPAIRQLLSLPRMVKTGLRVVHLSRVHNKFQFTVPKIQYVDEVRNSFIIEELVVGDKLSALVEQKPAELATEEVIDSLLVELLIQIFIGGFYHADPHEGNIFINKYRINFVDLGGATEISSEGKVILLKLLSAIFSGNLLNLIEVIKPYKGNIEFNAEFVKTIQQEIIESSVPIADKMLNLSRILLLEKIKLPAEISSFFGLFATGGYLFNALLEENRPIKPIHAIDKNTNSEKAFKPFWQSI